MTLVDLIDQHLENFGEIPTVAFSDCVYTNRQLISSANQLAHGLLKKGIKPKDRIVVMLRNSPDVIICYQAILRVSAVVVPVLFLLDENEVAHILESSQATAVITDKEHLDLIKAASKKVKSVEHFMITGDEEVSGSLNLNQIMGMPSVERPDVPLQEDYMAFILYTSGTTGDPKGVILTHKNLVSNAISASKLNIERKTEDVDLLILPMSHSFGLMVMHIGYLYSNLTVMMPWFEVEEACKLIEKYRVTNVAAVPTVFSMILNNPKITAKYKLTSLSECASGAAPLPTDVMEEFEKKFGCKIYQGYGLSEAGPMLISHYRKKPRKPGSIGQVVPNVELKIVDENDEEVGFDEVGELIAHGPSISPGYYNLPEVTKYTFRDGWLHTGDMVKMDEDGYFFLVDRKKDVIIRGGFNVIPRDIEDIIMRHPSVSDVAVVGTPDRIMGEEIKAYVALNPHLNADEEEIIEHCKDYLADYKCPKQVQFIKTVPRNAIGKLLRKKLRNHELI